MKSRVVIDLMGVPCPLSWARAKNRLEAMERGTVLELVTDDRRAFRDIPVAAEAEGYVVVATEGDPEGTSGARIVIER